MGDDSNSNSGTENNSTITSNFNAENDSCLVWQAARHGNVELLQELLSRGVEITRIEYKYSSTPLHTACRFGNLEVAKLLIQNGADIHATNLFGKTPFRCAFGYSRFNKRWKECLEVAKFMIENGAKAELYNVSDDDCNGWTLLHSICAADTREGSLLEKIKLLVEHGAQINVKDKLGRTPLYIACGNRPLEVLQFLIENDAEVNSIEDEEGQTALHAECTRGDLKVVKLLIENGAEINQKRNNGATVLHDACEFGHLDVIQLLLRRGGNVQAETKDGSTPLQVACEGNNPDVVWLLVRHQHPCLLGESGRIIVE